MKLCDKCGAGCVDEARFCPACGRDMSGVAPRSGDPFVGMVVGGHFVLKELIGEGGMGRVYRAEQKELGKAVAVKILHQHLIGDETAAARFQNEIRAASRLNHPNSISILDSGRTEGGVHFMAMEFLRGKSLERLLREEGVPPIGRVIDVLTQVLSAMEAAHALGMIHRDLKPENVFVEPMAEGDLVKVLDFGIVKFREDRAGLTQPGLVAGTPEYMSPEQARGEPLDARTDVYSLGVILFQCLTGELPFSGSNAMEVMVKHIQEPVIPPSKRPRGRRVPSSLDAIVLWAMAKTREDRIPSAAEFRRSLLRWAEVAPREVLWPSQADAPAAARARTPTLMTVERERRIVPPARHHEIPLVGRERERAALADAVADRSGRALWLQGPRGVGKTRLLEEALAEAIGAGYAFAWTGPDPTRAGEPLVPIRRLATSLLGLPCEPGSTADLREPALALGLTAEDLPGLAEVFALPDSTLGSMPPEVIRRERQAALRHLARAAAWRQPTIVLLDGVDRFDEASAALAIALLTMPFSGSPLLVLASARDGTPAPLEAEIWNVEPLPERDALELFEQVVGIQSTAEVRDVVLPAAQGLPLALHQLGHMEIEGGVGRVPARLVEIVAARVERLGPHLREVLQRLAVVGDEADPDLMQQAFSADVGQAADLTQQLVDRGYLRPSPRRPGQLEFVHPLLGEVVYAGLPAEPRREMHRALLAAYGDTAPVALVAHHAYCADDGDVADAADRAGCWAARCLDDRGAAQWFHRALEVVRKEWTRGRIPAGELDRLAIDLGRKLADVLRRGGDRIAAEGVLREALDLAGGRPVDRVRLLADLGKLALESGAVQRSVHWLTEAQRAATGAQVQWLRGRIELQMGAVLLRQGDKSGACAVLEQALQHCVGQDSPDAPPWDVALAAGCAYRSAGEARRAGMLLEAALRESERISTITGQMRSLAELGGLYAESGDRVGAEALLRRALALARRTGDRSLASQILVQLGRLRGEAGDRPAATTLIEEAASLAVALDWSEGRAAAESELHRLRAVGRA